MKGRIIGVYFPDLSLMRRVEAQAERLGLSASNLVANILEATIDEVERTPKEECDGHAAQSAETPRAKGSPRAKRRKKPGAEKGE